MMFTPNVRRDQKPLPSYSPQPRQYQRASPSTSKPQDASSRISSNDHHTSAAHHSRLAKHQAYLSIKRFGTSPFRNK